MGLNRHEYENYTPEHPELIPVSLADAQAKLGRVLAASNLSEVDLNVLKAGWWALFWIFPGLHPDGVDEWDAEFESYRPLAYEAFRRHEIGELDDSHLYPAEATHNRIWSEQRAAAEGRGTPIEDDDQRVVIRDLQGNYLARDEAGEIGWVSDRARAFRYFRKADAVDAQVREVKRRYGQEWIIEVLERPTVK
jgi:hypothetical protein